MSCQHDCKPQCHYFVYHFLKQDMIRAAFLRTPSTMASTAAMVVPNGLVGDWRLPDSTFLDTFVLPGAAQKVAYLENLHPLPRDSRIVFEEERHLYFIDGVTRAPKSVTKIVHDVAADFDALTAIASMRRGRNWKVKRTQYLREDGTEMDDTEIAAKWNRNGKVQSSRGTLMHFQIEQYLNGSIVEEPHSPEYRMFLRFREDFMVARGIEPFRTEISLFHCGLRVAGQADLLATEKGTGKIIILDWKRSKEIKYSNQFQKLKPPLEHMDDCNYSHYCLQLNVYRYILESEYGMEVGGMYLGVFHPDEPSPLCVEVPRLDREVALLVEHEKRTAGAGDPVPGPDAPFMGVSPAVQPVAPECV